MLLLTFSLIEKKNFMFIFSLFFIVVLENPAPFSLNLSSPITYFSKERLTHIPPPLSPTSKTKKIPLKTSLHFPITIVICKHWSKFVTCSPSPRDFGGVSHSQIHSYYGFRLFGTKWLSQNFDPLTLEKNERGSGPRCPPIFLVT